MIYFFLADGFEETEALAPLDVLRRAGIDAKTVGIDGKIITGSHNIPVVCDITDSEISLDGNFEGIFLPGGMPGTKNLEACETLMEQVEAFYKDGKCISAICAAPSIFGHKGFLKGRNAVSYPEFESHLEGAEVSRNSVEVSEHVTTSRGLGTAIDFGLAIVERYKGKAEADRIAKAIVYR